MERQKREKIQAEILCKVFRFSPTQLWHRLQSRHGLADGGQIDRALTGSN
jgi:hypothetical protein